MNGSRVRGGEGILKTQSSFSDLPQRFQNTPLFYSKLCGYELNFGAVALDKISID